MILFVLAALLAGLWGIGFRRGESDDLLPVESSTVINGFFTVLVLISHAKANLTLDKAFWADALYMNSNVVHSQLIVTTFLAFSGYGTMYQYLRRGEAYLKTFSSRRILRFMVHTALAVLLFVLEGILLGKRYSVSRVLLAIVGWTSVGNSNWYIFAILCLYFIFLFSAGAVKKPIPVLVLVTFLTGIYFAWMQTGCEMPTRFYNTAFCFPLGMLFCLCQKQIMSWKLPVRIIALAGSIAAFLAVLPLRSSMFWFVIHTLLFVCCVFMVSSLVRFGSPILLTVGGYVFEVYILQRLPMNFFKVYLHPESHRMLYVILIALITALLAVLFRRLEQWADGRLTALLEEK